MANFEKITGLIAATFTPFGKDGEVDTALVPKMTETLQHYGLKGAFICGSTGEGPSLLFEEKIKLIRAYAPFQSPDFKVMVMVGGTNQKEGILLAEEAQKAGLYGISATAPYYFRPGSLEQLLEYLIPLAGAAPELPFYFYHIPLLTQVNLSMTGLLEQVKEKIPNFAGIKYTHHDLMEFNRCMRQFDGEFDVLWGWDETFLAGLSMGAKGAVGSTYNYMAPLYQKIEKALDAGNREKALDLQQISIDIVSLYAKYGGMATGKAIMGICGLQLGQCRAPGVQLSPSSIKSLEKELESTGFLEYAMSYR
jgi:N-acetylneuraminate lyase